MSREYEILFDDLDEYFFDGKDEIANYLKNESMFFKLEKLYLTIINIPNYEQRQKELYGDRNKRQIIELELNRIKNHNLKNENIHKNVLDIEKLLKMSDDNEEMSENAYEKIVNLIIKLELSLGIDVGLFKEACKLFENENGFMKGTSYKKVRIGE